MADQPGIPSVSDAAVPDSVSSLVLLSPCGARVVERVAHEQGRPWPAGVQCSPHQQGECTSRTDAKLHHRPALLYDHGSHRTVLGRVPSAIGSSEILWLGTTFV